MRHLKRKHKVLLVLVVAALGYLAYAFLDLRAELFTVYDVPERYTHRTSPDADIVVVDFNKYRCKSCQELHSVLLEAIERDGRIIYAPRSISFQDGWSAVVTSAVYAAGEQNKFIEMFNGVYQNWPIEDDNMAALFSVAIDAGLDTKKLLQDMTRDDIVARAYENDQFYTAWGLHSTPTLLIGEKVIYRYEGELPTVSDLLDKFAQAREGGWL